MNTKTARKTLPLVMAAILAFGAVAFAPMTAYAATAQPVPSGAAVTISTPGLYNIATADDGATITVSVNGVALTGTHGNLSVVISAGITLTLKDASFTKTGSGTPVRAGGMGCVLILVGDNGVTGAPSSAGVNVPDTASLTIEGPGKLTARGGQYGAGIGGNYLQSSGAITIQHATIIAHGVDCSAGIGGGADNGDGANITIVNSSIDAHGGNPINANSGGGAGIGGGGSSADYSVAGSGTNITITGSAVVAAGGNGAGSGSAAGSSGGGAGIGGGGGGGSNSSNGCSGGSGTNITIDAVSTVQAIGGAGGSATNGGGGGGGAAIGGGGGAGGNNNFNGRPGGAGTGNVVGSALAAGSKGGTGNTPSGSGSKGGDGALGGGGGGGGNTTTQGSAIGTPGTELGSVTATGPAVDLSSRPDSGYTGYPALPTVTAPSNQAVTEGGNASFTVSPSGGTAPLVSQWQLSTDSGASWSDISGATTSTLTLTNVPLADNGKQYRCVVNDSVWREAVSGTATLRVQPNVTFTPSPSSINLSNPTNLVFKANAPALLMPYTFIGVSFQNVTVGTGFGRTLDSSDGVTYNPATGALTVPAAAFGQHATAVGGTPLPAGNYRAMIQFQDGASNDYDYYADFVLTSSGPPKPPSPLPKTGDGFPLYALLALLGAALGGMGWLGARLRRQKKRA